jgi:hypothetical protein
MMSRFTPKVYETTGQKRVDFFLGVAIWAVVNVLMVIGSFGVGALSSAPEIVNNSILLTLVTVSSVFCGVAPLIINVGGIVFLAFYRRWMAFGMLAAFGALLAIVMCIAIALVAACGIGLNGLNGI